jgi:hypothetical protein
MNNLEAYIKRNEVLKRMGFHSYQDYLKSWIWRAVRKKQLKKQPLCTGCGEAATEVHHLVYDESTMRGFCDRGLVSICRTCHESVEFDERFNKLGIMDVNKKLLALLQNCKRRTPK